MLKILQARLQQYVNRELPDVQAGLRKGRGTSPSPAFTVCRFFDDGHPLPDHAGESPLLSRSGGEKGLRGSGAGTLGVPLASFSER